MSLKKIYDQLGLDINYENEITKMNNRIIILVDNFRTYFFENRGYDYYYPNLIKEYAFLLGESDYYSSGYHGVAYYELKRFFSNDFHKNIYNLTLLLKASKKILTHGQKGYHTFLLTETKKVFDATPIEIGYLFTGETIIKKGAKELDEKLILDNLLWLSKYPNTKELYENALKHYLDKDYRDGITNAFSSLESLVKTFLNTSRSLDTDESRTELLKKLGLEKEWGQLLYHYCKLAHEFSSRHGKKENGEITALRPELSEFYIYLTGTFIRLISQQPG